MSEIKKYSKEWFALNGSDAQSRELKILRKHYYNSELMGSAFDHDLLKGTKEEVQEKLNAYQNKEVTDTSKKGSESQNDLIKKAGGLDNVFSILDSDKDGVVTDKEISVFAKIDSPEISEKNDTTLSLNDFKKFYENATDAKGSKHSIDGNTETFKFKDGSLTKLTKDEDGNIVTKQTERFYADKRKLTTLYDYKNNTTHYTVTDSKDRIQFASVDAPGVVNDKVTKTKYNDDNSKVETTETAGRTIVKNVNASGDITSQTETLKYNSDGIIGNTKQQTVGDCWILAGMNALRDIECGSQMIKDAIQVNPDKSITVKLKGINKEYTYTPEQISVHEYTDKGKYFSYGDIDMNLIEMAITDYRKEVLSSDPKKKQPCMSKASAQDPSRGGYLEEAIKYITGKDSKVSSKKAQIEGFLKNKAKDADSYAITAEFFKEDKSIQENLIINHHAYSVSRVTEDIVYVVNPWDSSKEIAYPRKAFLDNCARMASCNFK